MSLAVAPASTPVPAAPAAVPTPAPGATSAPAPPQSYYVAPLSPATGIGQYDGTGNYIGPSLRALPVGASDDSTNANPHPKFYTLTASLRESYDGNVSTSSSNQQASTDTSVSASILANIPLTGASLTGRYTAGATYYTTAPTFSGNGSSGNSGGTTTGSSLEINQGLSVNYSHPFSDRFQMSASDELSYSSEPDILESVGTNYQSGTYVSNRLDASLSAQWTPLFSTSASFGNTLVLYQEQAVGDAQNGVEDDASFSANYAIYPKISLSLGTVIDNSTYTTADRGYTSYTLFTGASWAALPSLSFSARAGGSYTSTVGGDNEGSFSPYAALSGSWTLGARSSLSFDYDHEISPSSQFDANGQESDRFTLSFRYEITPRLSASLDGSFTSSSVPDNLSTGSGGGYQENVYSYEGGLSYLYNSYLSFNTGFSVSGVGSNNSNNNYGRDEVYVGVSGTY